MKGNILLLAPILIPIISGLLINILKLKDRKRIHSVVIISQILNIIALLIVLNMNNSSLEIVRLSELLTLKLRLDDISRLFIVLASFLWLLVSFYSFEYMKHEQKEERFYTFFLMTLGVIMGIGYSGNLITFYLFYEFMTIITFPLVIHSMTQESMAAGIKYLMYSFFGAALVLIGIIIFYNYGASVDFLPGGVLDPSKVIGNENTILIAFVLAFIGFGSKAGMYPLHGWLPTAHPIAPAPASGLLSGIITKAGVLGILRMTYFVVGADFLRGTWAQTLIIGTTLFTIFMGSMLAYKTKHLKGRLAYSSVSQVSYVLFGLILLNADGFLGALLHVVFHALIKNVLFLTIGAIIYKTGKTYADEIKGIGKSMPFTMWCYTFASLALVGIPPLSGFVSKWYLAMGGLNHVNYDLGFFGVAILLLSALLTAGYLVPVFEVGFFPGQDFDFSTVKKLDPSNYMKIPLLILTIGVIILGMFPRPLIDFITQIGIGLF